MQQKKFFSNIRLEMVELGEIHMIYEKILQKMYLPNYFLIIRPQKYSMILTYDSDTYQRQINWTMNFQFLKDPTHYVWY